MVSLNIPRKNGGIVPAEALPIAFGKSWQKQPTRTKLWFYSGALKEIGDCHFFSCGVSFGDLNSLGANKDPRTWLNKAFSKHLPNVSRVMVLEANPKQNENVERKIGTNAITVHAHGVVALNGTAFTSSQLNEKFNSIFTGRVDRSDPRQCRWQDKWAIDIKECTNEMRMTGSKFISVNHAMGAMEYSTKDVVRTKRLLGLTDQDIPNWYKGSEVERCFPETDDRNHQFFKLILNTSAKLGGEAETLFNEMRKQNAIRLSKDYSQLEWKKIAKQMRDIDAETAARLIIRGAKIAPHQMKKV